MNVKNIYLNNYSSFKVVLYYLLFGLAWIILSDRVLLLTMDSMNTETFTEMQTYKGWVFVLVTACCLFYIVRMAFEQHLRLKQEMQAQEESHTLFLNLLQVGTYQTDTEGRIVFYNPKARELFGPISRGITKKTLFQRSLEPDAEQLTVLWEQAFQEGRKFSKQYSMTDEYGKPCHVIETAFPKFDDKQNVIGFIGTVTDVTSLIETQIKESELEQRLNLAVSAGNIGLWDWDIETNEVYFSEEWKAHLGYSEAEIENRFSEWKERLHPDDREEALARVEHFLGNNQTQYKNRFRLRHKDSSYRWIYAQASKTYDDQGNLRRVVGSHTDITPLREIEEAYNVSQSRMRHLLESSPTILYALDLLENEMYPIWVSESIVRILGYSVEEAMHKDWWISNLHENDKEQALVSSQLLLKQETNEHVYRFYDKAGNIHWIRDSARKVKKSNISGNTEIIGSWSDITSQHADFEAKKLLSRAIDCMHDGVLILDDDMQIITSNPASKNLTGLIVQPKNREPEIAYEKREELERILQEVKENKAWQGETRKNTATREGVPFWVTASLVRNVNDLKYILVYQDISELKAKEDELKSLAHYDSLTGLPNRLLLGSRIEHATATAQRVNGKIAVLYLDLDDFKNVNDSLGHSVGDELLTLVAARFQERVRTSDTLARIGGDEFVVLLENINSIDEAGQVAADLIQCLEAPVLLGNPHEVFVECCIGISVYPENGGNTEELLRTSDTAMYRAKKLGHNRYCYYSTEMGENVSKQLGTITALRQAIQNRELVVHYQPKMSVSSGLICGAEALVRWNRPGFGLFPPDQFIPLAENSDLINQIGSYVLEIVASQIRSWLDEGLDPVNVAVNVSARQFREQDLSQLLREVIGRYNLQPKYLGLEVTESALLTDPERVAAIVTELQNEGYVMSLDDFGTGYSSFSYLSRFTMDVLKIDASFIRRVNQSDKDNRIIIAMLELAQLLEMDVVAEGVESQDQLEFLKARKCGCIQGYLFSKPLPAEEMTDRLRAQVFKGSE